MQHLKITATLKSPIIRRGYLTFDSLLGALAFEKLGEWDLTKKPDGLETIACSEGLFHASAAIVKPHSTSPLGIAASMRWQHDWDAADAPKNTRGTPQALSAKRKREYGQVLSAYKAIHAAEVSWYVMGCVEGIAALLRGEKAIGKKRTIGFGHVGGWTISEEDDDYSIVGPEGQPMRPVPYDRFDGDRSLPLVEAAWRPAYWDIRNRAACYAPLEEVAAP